MGAVFTAAARAPLTSLASVVEMTGDFALTLPVMLAVAISAAISRALSYGTIYTTKLLRRGTDIDKSPPAHAFGDLTVADAMRAFPVALTAEPEPHGPAAPQTPDGASWTGPMISQPDPQVLFADESLAQALRQLAVYGRDGLPVLSADGQHLQGWITSASVLRAVARQLSASPAKAAQAQLAADWAFPDPQETLHDAPTPLRGYQLLETTITDDSPAAGQALGKAAWPHGSVPVSILRNRILRDPEPGVILAAGDRVSLLVPTAAGHEADSQPAGRRPDRPSKTR